MPARLPLFAAALALPSAAALPPVFADAQSTAPAALDQRVAELASGFCIDVLSRSVTLPEPGDAETALFARYGIQPGMPDAALTALGRQGTSLISNATLASGTATDGAFAIALGGAAGPSCRIIVYKAPTSRLVVRSSWEKMASPAFAWKALPPPPQPPAMLRLMAAKRRPGGSPYLATLIAPMAPGEIAMIVSVAAIPPNVTLPQGF
ncbi:hypothetical protein [Sphingomonas sp. KR3-1]|uniref:hypothetical protein n=1 Tax=Sphingomonas sp. KR3-1 TaxID=3156611 RepID=UPI0032B51C04